MLSDELKQAIRQNYSLLTRNKNLQNRPGQRRMIAEIAKGLGAMELDEEGRRVSSQAMIRVIEAGTGVGKTIAYLVAVLPIAQALGKKVILSTATVALQEQIIHKDIPDLLRHSDLRFSYALAKGRSRYLCLARLDSVLAASDSQDAMMDLYGWQVDEDAGKELYERMSAAIADGSWRGDRDDWREQIDAGQWRAVAVEKGQCSGSRCSHYSECFFYRSRDKTRGADCVVANHDLVLSDLSLGGGVILPAPEDSIYIFDEAHHLPAKGISHFSHFLRLRETEAWLERVKAACERLGGESGDDEDFKTRLTRAQDAAGQVKDLLAAHFPFFLQYREKTEADDAWGESARYVFERGVLDEEIKAVSGDILLEFQELLKRLERIADKLKQCMEATEEAMDRQGAENWYPVIGAMTARAEAAIPLWREFSSEDPADRAPKARWLTFSEARRDREITLSSSPVMAAEALADYLWKDCFAAILTSATLAALGRFDFLSARAGLHENTGYERVGSPFDYENAAVLRLPAKGFDPAKVEAHTQAIVDLLPSLPEKKKGALVLFSSRKQMQEVLARFKRGFRRLILSQDDHSKQELLRLHRERVDAGRTSIIFGLAGLTEGIDLPGDYCTHVVIAKIPFSVPSDPVGATLASWLQSQGQNPFAEIAVPEAAMKLVQASGRLLRTETDRGRITILDERLLTRRYGKQLLASLPPYRQEIFGPALDDAGKR